MFEACPANMIRCKNGETCGTLCNMMQDCPDGEDEDPLKCRKFFFSMSSEHA